uniref:Uncharacterized protein n=1 Tax=Oryza rufipogon TaxID=4529 RepID=A0A0E0QIZ6_ORYRU
MVILLFDHPSENREKPAFVARAFVAIVKLHKLCYSLSCLCVSDLGHFQHAREEDKTRILFLSFVDDAPPRPFHHGDVYQQVEVAPHYPMGFKAAAVAPDGVPPSLLRLKGWQVSKTSRTSYDGLADHAHWVDWPLRRRMPDLDGFGIGAGGGSPAAVVGKWYCPFMFIRDGERRLKDQVNRCMFYEMTLEQRWEEIYSCDNTHRGSISGKQPDDEVKVNVTVRRSTALLGGTGAVVQEGGPQEVDGVMWFRPAAPPPNSGAAGGVGVDMVVWEKMKWELERGGWVDGNGDVESIERVERREALGRYWDKPNGYEQTMYYCNYRILIVSVNRKYVREDVSGPGLGKAGPKLDEPSRPYPIPSRACALPRFAPRLLRRALPPTLPSCSLPLASSVTALLSSSPSGSPPLPASSPRALAGETAPIPSPFAGEVFNGTPPPTPFCAASSRHARPRTASDDQAWRARRCAWPPPLPAPLPSVSVRVESKGEADRWMHGRGGSVEVCFQGRRMRAASDRGLDALPIDLEVGVPCFHPQHCTAGNLNDKLKQIRYTNRDAHHIHGN